MNDIVKSERFTKIMISLALAGVLFLTGLALFALKSITISGASPIDVMMEIAVSAETTEAPAGTDFTYTIDYVCASINFDCEGVIISNTLPAELSWAATDVTLTGHPEHTVAEVYDEAKGQALFIFTDTIPATTSGSVSITARFPVTTANGTVAENIAHIDWINGIQTQSEPISMTAFTIMIAAAVEPRTVNLAAIEDSYVDYSEQDRNFNGRLLSFEYSAPFDESAGGYCPAMTKITYLKFDLSTIDFDIDKASLNLASYGACEGSDDQPLSAHLFGASDEWSENDLTWQNRPATQILLRDMTELQGAGVSNWENTSSGSEDTLANWLRIQQAKHGGDDIVTIGFVTPLPFGCSMNEQPARVLEFQDRERSGRGANCAGYSMGPTLQVASEDAELNNMTSVAPTAIELNKSQAITPTVNSTWTLFFVTATLMGGMTMFTLFAQRETALQTIEIQN